MTTTEVLVGVTTAEVRVREDIYGSCDAVEFTGPTNQAVFAAAADWSGSRESQMIIRAVTYAPYARTDENDCSLTLIYEPV